MSTPGARRLDRRQVLRAAAWTAPFVVAAVAAPAAVASPVLPVLTAERGLPLSAAGR